MKIACAICGKPRRVRGPLRDNLCHKCRAREKNKNAVKGIWTELPEEKPHPWKKLSDAEALDHLGSFLARHVNLNAPSPVIHYTPGTPEFAAIAAQYGG